MITFDKANNEENVYCDSCATPLGDDNPSVTKHPWDLCRRCYDRDYGTGDPIHRRV